MSRRTYRAAGALAVIVLTAMSPAGPGLSPATHVQAVGTVVDASGSVTAAADGTDGGPVHATGSAPLVSAPLVSAPALPAPLPSDGTGAVVAAPDTPGPATSTATIVPPAAPTGSGIPATVLAAYKNAATSLAVSAPGCHLAWPLLAGVGRVESGNASGGRVDDAGTTRGRILGPRLDGTNGTAVIHDTDGGALDGDTAFDRAVGPMQFIPSTWKTYGRDGNNDGTASPHNVFDAALTAGAYLCAGGSDLSQPIPARAALLRYNNSVAYGELVLRWAAAYAAGVSVLPNAQGEVPSVTPTPPSQVPAPATGAVDAPALAAATTGTTTSTTTKSSSSRTSTTTTTTTTPTTTKTTTPTTTTSPTTSVTTTSPPTTTGSPSTTSQTSPSKPTSSTKTSSTKTTTPTSATKTTTPTSSAPSTSPAATSTSGSATSGTDKSGSTKSGSAKSGSAKTGSARTSSSAKAAAVKAAAVPADSTRAVSSSAAKAPTTADGS